MQKTGMIRRSTHQKFGVKNPKTYKSKLHDSTLVMLREYLTERFMIALIGERGYGKSTLKQMLIDSFHQDETRPIIVEVPTPSRSTLQIGSVIDTMLHKLDVRKPGRSVNTKTINLVTALGNVINSGREVIVIIENTHRCDPELFSELRDLREQQFDKISPLFSVLLLGHAALEAKLDEVKEAGERTKKIHLNEANGWWKPEMRLQYLEKVWGQQAITPNARRNIASKSETPLDMDNRVGEAMEAVRTAGIKRGHTAQITEEVVPAKEQEILEMYGISYQDIADESNLGKSTVSNVLNNKKTTQASKQKVSQAIERLKQKQTQKSQAV